ncbi:thioredoxin [Candidatus Pacearchaeota archaeon]|nr:thioredoxin [Candidatus Pacearchaeota archaeon]
MITNITKENIEKEIASSETPLIIDFWASWCGPCQMMGPVFEELSSEYEGKLKFCKVDTQAEPEISSEFGIQGIPALSVIDKTKEVDRIVGFMPKDELKEKIDKILLKI